MRAVYLGLGSNQGDREAALLAAVRGIARWPRTRVEGLSSLYETAFVGPGEQADYLNACVCVRTGLAPEELLQRGKDLERAAGRRGGHLEPRPLDVDLLLDEGRVVDAPDLVVPHPRLAQRRFVLEPLAELDPVLRPAGERRTVTELLREPTVGQQAVRRRPSSAAWGEWCP